MGWYNLSKYGAPIWKIVLEAAKSLDKEIFRPIDIIMKVHQKHPDIPKTTIRTYVIAMAPDHPSSEHYPSTRKNHPYFDYLGSGNYKIIFNLTPECRPLSGPRNQKERFTEDNKETIRKWTQERFNELIEGRKNYSWRKKTSIDCINERNEISAAIVKSRIQNRGAVDLKTLDKVMDWGGFHHFPLRDENEVLEVTREAFIKLDNADIVSATERILSIHRVGISSASKIIGLYDQNMYAIYDSRVGKALSSLNHNGVRLLKCPPGRTRGGDACTPRVWAENYGKLLWILEIIRDYLNGKGYPFSIADVEMALFMMGK